MTLIYAKLTFSKTVLHFFSCPVEHTFSLETDQSSGADEAKLFCLIILYKVAAKVAQLDSPPEKMHKNKLLLLQHADCRRLNECNEPALRQKLQFG